MPTKTFRDVIWGDIELKEKEVAIVDSKPFQRLRRIKQLGMADLVYPCAKHTRFDHSLGTLSAAQLMVDNLANNLGREKGVDDSTLRLLKENIDCIRYFALLHDITHIPFGHTLEDEGKLYKRHDDPGSRRWDYYTEELKVNIPDNIYNTITKLHRKDFDFKENKFVYDIVSNTICADLIDYIQRDAYFTGATGLHFKFDDRILKYMTLEYDQAGFLRLVFKPVKDKIRLDVITDIIQLLRYRYMITERVTFHHARCAANAMLIKAIQLLGTPEEDFFYLLGDDDVLYLLSLSENENVRELGEMLKNRELFKIAFRVTSYTAPGLKEGSVSLVSQKYGKKDGREELEDELINEITKIPGLNNFEKNHIAIYCPPDEHMNFKETKVLVRWRSDIPTPLSAIEPWYNWESLIKDEVEALEGKYKALWNMHIFVHPKFKRHLYAIEKCCERVLGVKNDPLLERSFGRSEDYRDYNEYAMRLARMETEIITRARQIELSELSHRDSTPSAEGVKMDKKEALKEAIRERTLSEEREEKEAKDEDLQKKRRSQR